MPVLLIALILGIVEGITEFLPVSSTGHLILATELLGFDANKWAAFNVIIQLGAILAIVVLYWRTFWAVIEGLFRGNRMSWKFVRNILVAFLPAAVLGFILIKHIEALLGNATVVAIALIVGGVAILVIERLAKRSDVVGVAEMPLRTALGIGVVQCLAMIPGVSRSGATIMGGLSLGVERRTAAEFSFFLAIPTMLGATTLELVKNRHDLGAVGFVVSFIVALVVVRAFVHYISKHGFAPFAWYRIVVGAAALVWIFAR
jgi:undecaprenyl-diphosphatase